MTVQTFLYNFDKLQLVKHKYYYICYKCENVTLLGFYQYIREDMRYEKKVVMS